MAGRSCLKFWWLDGRAARPTGFRRVAWYANLIKRPPRWASKAVVLAKRNLGRPFMASSACAPTHASAPGIDSDDQSPP